MLKKALVAAGVILAAIFTIGSSKAQASSFVKDLKGTNISAIPAQNIDIPAIESRSDGQCDCF